MVELAVRVVLSLGVVLGLFWLVARTGSAKLGGRDRGLVRVRGRQSLTRGSSLAVVEVGSRVLVIGVSDGGVRLLTELDPAELGGTAVRGARASDVVASELVTVLSASGAAEPLVDEPAGWPTRMAVAGPAEATVDGPVDGPVDVTAVRPVDGDAPDAFVAAFDAAYRAGYAVAHGSVAGSAPEAEQVNESAAALDWDADQVTLTDPPAGARYAAARDRTWDVVDDSIRASRSRRCDPETALSGSLLSGATWRQAWDTARGRSPSAQDGDAA